VPRVHQLATSVITEDRNSVEVIIRTSLVYVNTAVNEKSGQIMRAVETNGAKRLVVMAYAP
jgi:hypothetical protein